MSQTSTIVGTSTPSKLQQLFNQVKLLIEAMLATQEQNQA